MPLKSSNWQNQLVKPAMGKTKRIVRRLLFPPGWTVAAVSMTGYTLLIFVFHTSQTGVVPYLSYFLSAYAFLTDILMFPRLKSSLKKRKAYLGKHNVLLSQIRKTHFGKSYLEDRAFRGSVGIYQGMIADFLYTIFHIVADYTSVWFLSMAAYHMVLGILRMYLIFRHRRRPCTENTDLIYEYHCYQTIGKLLLVLNIPMVGTVILIIVTNSSCRYPGVAIYVSACYTFYMMVLSIMNVTRFRKLNRPILLAAKMLNVVAAAMSLLRLQAALIAQFDKGEAQFRKLMNTLTGTGVCVLVTGMAVYMIVYARRKIRMTGGNRLE